MRLSFGNVGAMGHNLVVVVVFIDHGMYEVRVANVATNRWDLGHATSAAQWRLG